MWEDEYSVEMSAEPTAVWARLVDVTTWPDWDIGVSQAELHGPFDTGMTGVITPNGQNPLPFRIVEVLDQTEFVDETELSGEPGSEVTVYLLHRVAELPDGGARVTRRVEILGPGAEERGPTLGPAISADFPETLRALAEAAGGSVTREPHG